ncbi:MAG TPA: hypothetical protein VK176_15680 [Phycisphaerales bacterium]|nr:hypothetical protein [Phycisphaerales bacterium]
MRAFWVIVALLVIGAGWLVLAKPSSTGPAPSLAGEPAAERSAAPASASDTAKALDRETSPPTSSRLDDPAPGEAKTQTPAPAPAPAPAPKPAQALETKSPENNPPEINPVETKPVETKPQDSGPSSANPPSPTTPTPAEPAATDQKTVEAGESLASDAKASEEKAAKDTPAAAEKESKTATEVASPTTTTAPAVGPTGGTPTPASTAEGAVPAAETGPLPAKFEKLENGDTKVDARFIVKGEGTLEKPYEVTWEHLISASELYNPRNGKKRLPERVMMLDGKYVKMSGYVAFPMYVDRPKELLSMLNQWDGCCIGIPPTPYDAIEVRLKNVVEGGDRYATQGQVTGKFSVKPYLAGDWLVGLYVMDDAVFTTKSTAGATRN